MSITKSKSLAVVAALSTVLALPAFAMADRHGGSHGGDRGGDRGRGSWHGHNDGHRGHSGFSFSLGLGAFFAPSYYRSDEPCYAPAYTYYQPAPVYYAAPAYTTTYYSPAPVYYSSGYYAPTYYAPAYYGSANCYVGRSAYVGARYYYRR